VAPAKIGVGPVSNRGFANRGFNCGEKSPLSTEPYRRSTRNPKWRNIATGSLELPATFLRKELSRAIQVSNFDRTAATKERMRVVGCGARESAMTKSAITKSAMTKTDQFWRYAKEAIVSAYDAKTDTDKEGLLELARTWTQAALQERATINQHD
jgi:hypothetical protein